MSVLKGSVQERGLWCTKMIYLYGMKKKKGQKRQKTLRITEADHMLAERRAARLVEIAEHGKPMSFRKAIHKSKKVYDRKRLKKVLSED